MQVAWVWQHWLRTKWSDTFQINFFHVIDLTNGKVNAESDCGAGTKYAPSLQFEFLLTVVSKTRHDFNLDDALSILKKPTADICDSEFLELVEILSDSLEYNSHDEVVEEAKNSPEAVAVGNDLFSSENITDTISSDSRYSAFVVISLRNSNRLRTKRKRQSQDKSWTLSHKMSFAEIIQIRLAKCKNVVRSRRNRLRDATFSKITRAQRFLSTASLFAVAVWERMTSATTWVIILLMMSWGQFNRRERTPNLIRDGQALERVRSTSNPSFWHWIRSFVNWWRSSKTGCGVSSTDKSNFLSLCFQDDSSSVRNLK